MLKLVVNKLITKCTVIAFGFYIHSCRRFQ